MKFPHFDMDCPNPIQESSVDEMNRVLNEYEYVFGRSTVFVDEYSPRYSAIGCTDWLVSPSASQWGSQTNITLRIAVVTQDNADSKTWYVKIVITGNTVKKRLGSIGLGDRAIETFNESGEPTGYMATFLCRDLPTAYLPYSPKRLKIMLILYKHDIQNNPGLLLVKKAYRIETLEHSCENCEDGRCFYSDFDGKISFPDYTEYKFHVTCSGNIQLLLE